MDQEQDLSNKITQSDLTTSRNISQSDLTTSISQSIYPFINEMVDSFYTKECNELIEGAIDSESDKSIFMMYIMMYFGIHLKLERENDETKKHQIKLLLTDLIRDHEKRKYCIEMFQNKFQNVFLESSSKENKNLLVKDKNK